VPIGIGVWCKASLRRSEPVGRNLYCRSQEAQKRWRSTLSPSTRSRGAVSPVFFP